MKLSSTAARRTVAVASAVCAAVLVPAVALASPARPAAGQASRAAAPAKCLTSQLRVWVGVPGNGAAGSTNYQLELSNISGRACTLLGYPGLSAFGPHGQLGSAAVRSSTHPLTLITLHTGGTAHVELQITDVGVFSKSACRPVTALGLQVFPPNDFTAQRFPFSFRACSKRGPAYLHVTAAVSGTGIPGFSS